jgi:hypothetical protein
MPISGKPEIGGGPFDSCFAAERHFHSRTSTKCPAMAVAAHGKLKGAARFAQFAHCCY